MAASKNPKSERPAGPEGHRDEDDRFEARAKAWRLHEIENHSFRDIAIQQGTSVSTAKDDVDWYTRYLRNEIPKTFEAWRARIAAKYRKQYEMAEALAANAKSSFVQAQALKMMTEITQLEAKLFGVDLAVTAPEPDEAPADDGIEWDNA